MLAERDLLQRGTWIGLTKQGRFSALTNFSRPAQTQIEPVKILRRKIVTDYLTQDFLPIAFLQQLRKNKADYNGFNVIVGNTDKLVHFINMENKIKRLL